MSKKIIKTSEVPEVSLEADEDQILLEPGQNIKDFSQISDQSRQKIETSEIPEMNLETVENQILLESDKNLENSNKILLMVRIVIYKIKIV